MTKARKIAYGSILGLIAVLFVLGGIFDLAIAERVYQPDNFMAKLFESVGIFPPFLFVACTFTVLFFLVRFEDKYRVLKQVLCVIAVIIAYFIFAYMASEVYFEDFAWRMIVTVTAALSFTALSFIFFRNVPREKFRKLAVFLIFASIVSLISSLLTVHTLKYFWGRPRYRELVEEGLAAFTPWYKINGFSLHGHHSFPSGHTCSATNLLVFLALEEVFPEVASRKKTIALVVGMYIFTMAYSRLVMGAHFLSDVTAGFFIGFITYAVARYIYFDKSRAVVTAIMKSEESGETLSQESEEQITETTEPVESGREEIEIPLGEDALPAVERSSEETPSAAEDAPSSESRAE